LNDVAAFPHGVSALGDGSIFLRGLKNRPIDIDSGRNRAESRKILGLPLLRHSGCAVQVNRKAGRTRVAQALSAVPPRPATVLNLALEFRFGVGQTPSPVSAGLGPRARMAARDVDVFAHGPRDFRLRRDPNETVARREGNVR